MNFTKPITASEMEKTGRMRGKTSFKLGFVEETRKGTLLKKGSLDPPKTFGAGDHEADW